VFISLLFRNRIYNRFRGLFARIGNVTRGYDAN